MKISGLVLGITKNTNKELLKIRIKNYFVINTGPGHKSRELSDRQKKNQSRFTGI